MGFYVYAVVPSTTRIPGSWRGLRSEPLRLVRCGSVGLVVGEDGAPLKPTRPNLERHDALMRRIVSRVPALLPARFALIIETLERLRALVEAASPVLQDALRLVSGREQMTLRVRAADAQRAPKPRRPPGRLRKSRLTGSEYLRTRAAEVRAPHDPQTAGLLRRLSGLVRDERVGSARAADVRTFYHLIERGQSKAYRAVVSEFTSGHPSVRVSASGPFPPYAFAPDVIPKGT